VRRPPAPATAGAAPGRPGRHTLLLIGLGAFLLEWLPSLAGPYGYFVDELYYLACARRLAWGYVDHPPLSVATLALLRAVAGEGLPWLRLLPALLAGGLAAGTGFLAWRLGAGRWGQALAAIGIASAGAPMVLFSFYSMNAFDLVLWTLALWLVVEIEARDVPRLWLAFGLVLGIGLMNKHTMVLLPLALGAGMLLTRARRHLRAAPFWGGLAVAGALVGPNLLWQATHGWPSLEFYRNAGLLKNNPTPPHEVVLQQVLTMNPLALPLWLGGLLFLLGGGWGGRLRHLGWVYPLLLAGLALGHQSRPDRLAPVYPLLFAAGGAAADAVLRRRGMMWPGPAGMGVLLLGVLVLAPISLPVLPPAVAARYAAALGVVPQIEAGAGKRAALPQWLADRLGWPALVADVTDVVGRLPPAERAGVAILAPTYGQAGALELAGHAAGLPPVYSGHNSYSAWGPPPDAVMTLVVVGYTERHLRPFFRAVEHAATHRCAPCTPWRDGMPIWIVRDPLQPMSALWAMARHFE
jgi:4-amino-4-deoxy-L-arabinose transferase-like glycosyltransferase